jgi:hypothetical protein
MRRTLRKAPFRRGLRTRFRPGSTKTPREVEMHVLMASEPAIVFRSMSIEIVEDDVDGPVRVCANDAVHEVQELDPPAPFIMPSRDFAGYDIEGREQSRGPVPFVIPKALAHWQV